MSSKAGAYRARKPHRRSGWSRFIKGAGTAVSVASKALAVAQGVAALLNPEYKVCDTTATATAVNTTPAINCITAVAAGDALTNRNGNSIKGVTIAGRFHFKWNGSEVDEKYAQRCRLLIIRDLNSTASATPTIAEILSETATAQNLMQSYINLNNGKRWNVLYDKILQQDNSRGGLTLDWFYKFAKQTKQVDKVSRKCNPHITFKGTSSTNYDFGHVWVVLIGDIASGSSTATCEYMTRLRFLDN